MDAPNAKHALYFSSKIGAIDAIKGLNVAICPATSASSPV
jgi:hypothetical protein